MILPSELHGLTASDILKAGFWIVVGLCLGTVIEVFRRMDAFPGWD